LWIGYQDNGLMDDSQVDNLGKVLCASKEKCGSTNHRWSSDQRLGLHPISSSKDYI